MRGVQELDNQMTVWFIFTTGNSLVSSMGYRYSYEQSWSCVLLYVQCLWTNKEWLEELFYLAFPDLMTPYLQHYKGIQQSTRLFTIHSAFSDTWDEAICCSGATVHSLTTLSISVPSHNMVVILKWYAFNSNPVQLCILPLWS